jgi:predicted regulator of Ras-like GTPase activity (Roadblock/LC7/MglB family)
VAGCDERELRAWESRSLIGCLYDYQRNTDAVCSLLVQDDASILAKVTAKANLNVNTLGVFSSMIFATSQMLVRELGSGGEVLGRINLGPSYYLLVMGVTPNVALVTLCKKPFAEGLLEHQARAMMPRMIDCLAHSSLEGQ